MSDAATLPGAPAEVVRVGELEPGSLEKLLDPWGIEVAWVADAEEIPSSYFGDCEAGIRGSTVFVRRDTPVHSALHEAFHLVCAGGERRATINGDAGDGDFIEEIAVCYLQLLVADQLAGFDFARACADMDAWGYTFRVGSALEWFRTDAEDAIEWLARRGLLDAEGHAVPQVT